MCNRSEKRPHVAVLGGGITGLAAAHRLSELAPEVKTTLFEAKQRVGGILKTDRRDGFLLECGADNFITNLPEALDLCRRIGFEDQLVNTNDRLRQAFVVSKGKLCSLPDGFIVMAPSKLWPLVTTPILSPLGKLRMAWEYFVRSRHTGDESLASFATRRFGRQTYERLIQPLVGSIYAMNPDRLSLQATLPRFIEMEQKYGSLIRGALKQRAAQKQRSTAGSGAPYSLFMAPREGMSALVSALADRLPDETIQLNSPIDRVQQNSAGGWTLSQSDGQHEPITVDGVIVATPARVAADALASIAPELSSSLSTISYSSSSIVSLGFKREQVGHALDGFGFVVPAIEGRRILSASFSSVKYPGRAPDSQVLARVFINGAAVPDMLQLSEKELISIALSELDELLSISGQPIMHHVVRYTAAMPQYELGHGAKIEAIRQRTDQLPGLELAGNAYEGIGIPNCIRSAEGAAERVLAELGVTPQPATAA
jgi:oxygen-dependent protoporphyrinogen oxidase